MFPVRPARDLFAKYQVHEKLGSGRFGTVRRCTHRATEIDLACKRVNPQEEELRAARNEIAALTLLHGCTHVTPLRDVFRDSEGALYIVSDLASGGDLVSHIMKNGPLSERDAREIFRDIATGVQECHERGILHRDIKPDNVLLFPHRPAACAPFCAETAGSTDLTTYDFDFESNRLAGGCTFAAKLADFGGSTILKPGQTAARGYCGSMPYMAPEVAAGKHHSFSADVWSMGVTLYSMLSGRWPTITNGRQSSRDWKSPCWASVSGRAKSLIRRMLSSDPLGRPTVDRILHDAWLCGSASFAVTRQTACVRGVEPHIVEKTGYENPLLQAAVPRTGPPRIAPFRAILVFLSSTAEDWPSNSSQAGCQHK